MGLHIYSYSCTFAISGAAISFLIKVKCVTTNRTMINEACWCYRDANAHKWYSPDVREHVAKITLSSFLLEMHNISTDTDN